MKKKIFLSMVFVLLQILVFHPAKAQLSMERQKAEVTIPTSQTYDFIRQGTVGASLYTGTVNYSLPVYTYKDKDFNIPISLDYASNGFKPNARAAELGLGWTLHAGGCVTRKINDMPDEAVEHIIAPISTAVSMQGFLWLNQSNFYYSDLNPQIAMNGTGGLFFYQKDQTSKYNYEFSPDIFYFNFLGHSGYFHLWYNSEIKVYSSNPNDPIKAEINKYGATTFNIIFTTGDGYKYYFGGGEPESEYVISRDNSANTETTTTHTWKLYYIAAPNGRSVSFTYQDVPGYYGKTYNYQPLSTYAHNIFGIIGASASQTDMKNIQSTGMYSKPLTKIKISDGPSINFSYITTTGELSSKYFSSGGTESAFATPKLSNIKVMYGSDTLARCNIAYKTSNPAISHDPRLKNTLYFLGSVNIKGEGVYNFEYYNRTERGFPALGSFSVDHWGYYNAKNDYTTPRNFIDYLSYTDDYAENINTDIRNSDSTYTQMGMLKQINYPQGGYSLLTYEPHRYSQKVERGRYSSFIPRLVSTSSTMSDAGGMRIKRVETYNTTGDKIDSQDYSYIGKNNASSGTLLTVPRYGILYLAAGTYTYKTVKYYNLYNLYNIDNTDVEYSRIVQTNHDGSKKIYNYSTYSDYPDFALFDLYPNLDDAKFFLPTCILFSNGQYTYSYFLTQDSDLLQNILSPLASMQRKRGKLISLETLNLTDTIRKTSTNYAIFNNFMYNYPLVVGERYRMIGVNYFTFWPTASITTNKLQQSNITETTTYTYNPTGQISSTTVTNSKGDQQITRYEYPTDYASSGGIYTTMIAQNMLDYPVIIREYYKSGNNETLIAGKRYTYALFNNIIKLSKTEYYNAAVTSWQHQTTFNSYDSKGNLTQSTDNNGIATSYIWGYNGLYLVAKGENLPYSTLSAHVGGASSLKAGVTADHATVRNNSPRALIDFYEYKPFVGLSKHTNPSGKTLTYSYNLSGKLKAITDENGKLHNEYLYSPDNKQQ